MCPYPLSPVYKHSLTPPSLKQLESVQHRQLAELAKVDQDTAAVVQWLRQNQHRFQQEILEPPILSVTVPDKLYASAVEACFSMNQLKVRFFPFGARPRLTYIYITLKTFVAQNDADYRLLNKLVSDNHEELGRKVRFTSVFVHDHGKTAQPPMNLEEVRPGLLF